MAKKKIAEMMLDDPLNDEESAEDISREEILKGAAVNRMPKAGGQRPGSGHKTRKEAKRIFVHTAAMEMLKQQKGKKGYTYITSFLEEIFGDFLQNPKAYDLHHASEIDGAKKYQDVRLDPQMIDDLQAQADTYFEGNFSLLVRELIKAWARNNKCKIKW